MFSSVCGELRDKAVGKLFNISGLCVYVCHNAEQGGNRLKKSALSVNIYEM